MTPSGLPLQLRINFSACRGRTRCGECLRLVPELARGPVPISSIEMISEQTDKAVTSCPEGALIIDV